MVNNVSITACASTLPKMAEECAICLCEMLPEDKVTLLDCNHRFHNHCILRIYQTECRNREPFVKPLKEGRPFHKKSYQCSMFLGENVCVKCPLCRTPHTYFSDDITISDGKITFNNPHRILGRVYYRDAFSYRRALYCHHITCEDDLAHYFMLNDYRLWKAGMRDQLSDVARHYLRYYDYMLRHSTPLDFHVIKCSCDHTESCYGVYLTPARHCLACKHLKYQAHASVHDLSAAWFKH